MNDGCWILSLCSSPWCIIYPRLRGRYRAQAAIFILWRRRKHKIVAIYFLELRQPLCYRIKSFLMLTIDGKYYDV